MFFCESRKNRCTVVQNRWKSLYYRSKSFKLNENRCTVVQNTPSAHAEKSGPEFLNIFCTHVATRWAHDKKYGTKILKIVYTHVPTSWRHVRNTCPFLAKSICYFSVCHWIVSQGSTSSAHNSKGLHGGGVPHRRRAPQLLCAKEVETRLTTQWQTET